MKIAVLGGGITGCVTTHLLLEQGHHVRCLEAAPRTGGLCGSETLDGFVADKAGGHIIFSKDQEVMDFVLRMLEPIGGHHTTRRQTHIHYKGTEVQYPFENGIGDLPQEDRFLCLRDYIEAQFARRTGVASPMDFEGWCVWRFGQAMCDQFMHPYNQKIWNIPLSEMGIQWVAGRVPDAPLDDVLRSAIGFRTEGYTHQSVFHYPLEGGFESIVNGVLRRIPEGVVSTSAPCHELEKTKAGFLVNGEAFDRVVSTIPLQELVKCLKGVPDDVVTSFARLDYVSLFSVFLALDKASLPPHSWAYFPHEENGPQNRITYLSNYSPRNAPPGKSSVMAEVTYYRQPPASDETITNHVVEGLERCGVLRRSEVMFTKGWHSKYAYILYRTDLESNLDRVRSYCNDLDLDIIGRFGNYNYFNSDMCIRAAMDLANRYATL